MTTLTKAVNAQWPIVAEFSFTFADSMVNTAAAETSFGAVGTFSYDIMTPPPGAVVVGGTILNVAAASGPTVASLDLGDSDDPNRYTPTIHNRLSATAHTVLTPAGAVAKVYSGNQPISMEVINTVAPDTAGSVRISVQMVASGKATENLKTT